MCDHLHINIISDEKMRVLYCSEKSHMFENIRQLDVTTYQNIDSFILLVIFLMKCQINLWYNPSWPVTYWMTLYMLHLSENLWFPDM